MDPSLEDHTQVGRTYPHPNADLANQQEPAPSSGVVGRMVLAVLLGGFFGYLLSVIVAPGFGLAFTLGGAMSFAAGTVVLLMRKDSAPDVQIRGNARTDEDVRQALAEIKDAQN